MDRVTGVGGVFSRAADPAALARWHADHLGVDPAPQSSDVAARGQQAGPRPRHGDPSPVVVRAYRRDDAAGTHAAFRSAVTRTAAADYTPAQTAAWAGATEVDLGRWDARRAAAHTFVAVVERRIAGFVDLLDDGLLDMLFVHADFGRRGIARLLVRTVRREAEAAGLPALRTYASRTAKPAFERFGFRVVTSRPDNVVNGQTVPNYEMRCTLGPGSQLGG